MPVLPVENLRPYKSFVLFMAEEAIDQNTLGQLTKEARQLISKAARGVDAEPKSFEIVEHKTGQANELLMVITYRLRVPASWYEGEDGPVDVINHVLLLFVRRKFLLLCASDKALGRKFAAAASTSGQYETWSSLTPVSALVLNALIHEKQLRTLWLSGLHRPVSVKADSKVLSGQDLRDALDPLGDQTYQFTSARPFGYKANIGTDVIGISPRQAKVWIGPSRTWEEFIEQSRGLVQVVETAKEVKAPVPIVATEIESLSEVKDAFEVALLPPEQLADTAPDVHEQVEDWTQHGTWSVAETDEATFHLTVAYGGEDLGEVVVEFHRIGRNWRPTLTPLGRRNQQLDEFVDLCQRPDILKVYFESQHAYSGGAIFLPHFRDIPFLGFRFDAFRETDIDREKPYRDMAEEEGEDPGLTGEKGDRSLFTWCWSTFRPGWLWCDDGAGEIADFIHLEPKSNTLRFIHVKAAGSRKKTRQVAVAPYEVVCSQALKNLRYLERTELSDALDAKLRIARVQRAWRDGKPLPKADWFRLAGAIAGTPYSELNKEVVIVQPHVSKDMLQSKNAKEIMRVRQLHSLLNSVRAEVNRLAAVLAVYIPEKRG